MFVGVMSVAASMWAWDQLFLDGWSRTTLVRLALAVLVLIKPWVMRARMYSGARKVSTPSSHHLFSNSLVITDVHCHLDIQCKLFKY